MKTEEVATIGIRAIEAVAHAKIDLRDAEIRRLREALETIANWQGGLGVEWPMDIARRVLSANGALTGNRREEQG